MRKRAFSTVAAVMISTTALLFLLCLMGRAWFDASRPALAFSLTVVQGGTAPPPPVVREAEGLVGSVAGESVPSAVKDSAVPGAPPGAPPSPLPMEEEWPQISRIAGGSATGMGATGSAESVELVGHFGGWSHTVAVQGNYAYMGVGPGLVVFDVSNPASPTLVGQTRTMPDIVRAVAVAGNYAYVAAGYGGLRIVNISNPATPTEVGLHEMPWEVASGVAVAGNYAYVACGGLHIVNVANPVAPTEAGFYETPGGASDVAVAGNYAYVADGSGGLRVVNVANPAVPTEVAFLDPVRALDVTVVGDYVYAVASGGLHIVNVSNPGAPTEVGLYKMLYGPEEVAVVGNYAYLADGYGLHIVNVSNPATPTEVGFYDSPQHLCVAVAVAGNHAYVSNRDRLRVINVSNPAAPTQVGFYDLPAYAERVTVAGNYAYVTDEQFRDLHIINVANPAAPSQASFHEIPGWVYDVAVAGNYAYVAAGQSGDLRIIDVSNPAAPTEVGFYDMPGLAVDVAVAGGYAYVAAAQNGGFHIINVANPAAPTGVFSDTSLFALDVAVAGHYAYVTAPPGGLLIFDVSNPAAATVVGSYPGAANDVTVAGDYAYCSVSGGLNIIDVSDPTDPSLASFYGVGGGQSAAVAGNRAYLAAASNLHVINVADPAAPTEVGFYETPGYAWGVAVAGDHVYVADTEGGLLILRFTGEKNTQLTGLYVDDGFERPLANLPWLAWPLNVNKAPGDKLDVVATIYNGEATPQNAYITVTLPSTASWTLTGCYLRSNLSGQGDQVLGDCALTNQKCGIPLPNFPANATRQVVLRFQLPSDIAPGRVTLSAALELERGYPSHTAHQMVSFNVVNRAPAIVVTNRRLLYEKYPDDQAASLLQELASVAQGTARGTQAAVIYYADWYDDAVVNWDNAAITYTNPVTVNQVADVIDSHIVTWTRRFTPTYLMIVGGDEIIPFYRVSDVPLANVEKTMNYPLGRPAFNAIRSNYFFSDAPYADTRGNDWLSGELELAPGRIVGVSAQEMRSLLLRGAQSLGDSANAFVGSDVRNDVDDVVSGLKARGLTIRNDGGANDTTENNTWSKAVMTTTMRLGFRFFAHSHHGDYDKLKAGTGSSFFASEVSSVNSDGAISDNRPFVSTSACHAGLVVDPDGTPQSSDNLVWAFIHEGSSAYLGSGAFVCLNKNNGQLGWGEKWFNDFYSQVVTQSHAIGDAYRLASVNFNPSEKYERRSVVQFILYGVPWMEPAFPGVIAVTSQAVPQTLARGYHARGAASGLVASGSSYTKTVDFTVTDYRIVTDDGYELVTIPGADLTFNEHKPILPKLHGPTLYLPPGASVAGISMTTGITTSLGTHHIPSAQPSTTAEPTSGYTDTTDVVGTYPDPIYGYDVSTFADHTEVTPFIIAVQYNPQTQETTLWQTVTLEISYQAPVPAVIADFATDKTDYSTGEAINAIATVANAGASDLTNLTAQLAVKDLFGQVQGTASSAAFNVAAGGTQEVSVPFAGALSDGTYSLELAIVDAPTTLATSSRYVRVSSGQIVSFSVPSEIVGWPAVTFSISYKNDSTSSQEISGTVQVYDAWGEEVASLSAEPVSVGAGQTRDVELNWDPHYEPAGDYVAVASVTADSRSYGPDFGPFRIILEEVYLPVVLRSYP